MPTAPPGRPGGPLTVIRAQLAVSLQTAMQYRLDFVLHAFMSLFWLGATVASLYLVYGDRATIGGWSRDQALLVMGFFLTLKGLLEAFIQPNLMRVVEHIRKGTLDFILLKPADPQLLVSLGRIDPAALTEVLGGAALITFTAARLNLRPSLLDLLATLAMFGASTTILYSIWLMAASIAFWFVRVDNLAYMFGAIFDAARWPVVVFRGWVRFVLTFILPVLLMTSWPAIALAGQLDLQSAAAAALIAAAFALLSRSLWRYALRHYTSASS